MAWIDIGTSIYSVTAVFPYQKDFTNNPVLTLQYDDTAVTPTKATFRFKLGKTSSGDLWDMFYVLLDPTNAEKRTLHALKTAHTQNTKANWPYIANSTFDVSKGYSDATFTIPELWICNDGQNATSNRTALGFYNHYNDSEWRGQVLRVTQAAKAISVAASSTVATDVGVPALTITDNGNNTFTIAGTDGANGTNNTATTAYSWGYDNKYGNSGLATAQTLPSDKTSATVTVYAKAVTTGTYGTAKTTTKSLAVKNYKAPNAPGVPQISYNKSRLTVKENWTYTWSAATRVNTNSSIAGYRIRVYKDGKEITGLAATTGSTVITKGTGASAFLDRNTTDCSIVFNPVDFGFTAGNKVKVRVQAYAKNAKKTLLLSSEADSAELEVLNAGVMRIRSGNDCIEGIVKVWDNGGWQEADLVKIKTPSGWAESE